MREDDLQLPIFVCMQSDVCPSPYATGVVLTTEGPVRDTQLEVEDFRVLAAVLGIVYARLSYNTQT